MQCCTVVLICKGGEQKMKNEKAVVVFGGDRTVRPVYYGHFNNLKR